MHGFKLFMAGALLALGACGGKASVRPADAPAKPVIQDQSKPLREPESPYRVVVPGDTLYSIAWESGRDHRELAIWNKIAPPYTIKPGQQIRVLPPEKEAAAAETKPATPNKPATKTATAKPPAPKPVAKPGTPPTTPVTAKPAPAKTETKTATAKSSVPLTPPKSGEWAWPADGSILNQYSDSSSKGLDIGGSKGAPVRAAATGRVVYQGSGLRGYGQLIIIKHSDEFLSAYAHNDRIHVKEGDVVKRGQKIADMGSTGTDRVKLHFEIRRQGTPIDPLKYLPKR
jgi:lipoprotein NlpD